VDAVFLSPPWGGPAYIHDPVFDLHHMCPDGVTVLEWARRLTPNVCFFMPRNTSIKQLVAIECRRNAGGGKEGGAVKLELEQNLLNGRVKTVSVYYGDLPA
jgi:trimethylguanosine synthase